MILLDKVSFESLPSEPSLQTALAPNGCNYEIVQLQSTESMNSAIL